jgi:hypothetical protein
LLLLYRRLVVLPAPVAEGRDAPEEEWWETKDEDPSMRNPKGKQKAAIEMH